LERLEGTKSRIFTGQRLTYLEVAVIARDGILQRERAFAAGRFFCCGIINMPSMYSLVGFSLLLNKKAVLLLVAPKNNNY
jgi:hypothetical protein